MRGRLIMLVLCAMFGIGASAFAEGIGGLKTMRPDVDINDPAYVPEVAEFTTAEPGETKKLTRSHENAPPQIPHMVDSTMISLKRHECMECHTNNKKAPKEAPKMKPSHYTNQAGKVMKTVYQGRYFCFQCHVPQSDAKPIVKNLNNY